MTKIQSVFTAFSAGAVESLDPQVLLDPFEEEFHLPAALVDLGDGKCLVESKLLVRNLNRFLVSTSR